MDVLSTFQRSNNDSDHSFRRNKPVHFGGSLDFLYCTESANKVKLKRISVFMEIFEPVTIF